MQEHDDRRLAGLRHLVTHLSGLLQADLALTLWTGERLSLGPGPEPDVGIAIRDPAALTRLARRPRLSTVIEEFADGLIEIAGGTLPDLAARRGSARTRGLLERLDKRHAVSALWPFLIGKAETGESQASADAAPRKVEDGRDDKALIHFHYDLSNAFYSLFLDAAMVYSCAYFPDPMMTLDQAQEAKLDMICGKLRLKPGDRFLDIGCGWGGLVCHAAQNFGVIAHGVTLAQEQYAFALEKIARLGLQDRVTVELKDYRHVDHPGGFDKIASIGMFEHVGLDGHDAYFRTIHALLRPRGIYLHHAIARPSKRDARGFRRVRPEFKALTRYIFPGGELDAIGMSLAGLERNGFEVHDVEGWREHYARTCRLWTERLHANREAAAAEVGWPKTRLWLLYLAGCALAFERSAVGVFQTVATKKDKGPSGLPPSRADLYPSA